MLESAGGPWGDLGLLPLLSGQGRESGCRQAVKPHSQVSLLTLTAGQEINPQSQWQEHVGPLQAWHPAGAPGPEPRGALAFL